MTTNAMRFARHALLKKITDNLRLGDAYLSKKDFLLETWDALSRLVHHNKENPLIKEAVRKYPVLIPQSFTILSILFGTYTCEPKKAEVLKDFVALLGKDLTEEELRVWEYAKGAGTRTFFPELAATLEAIRFVYGAEHFSHYALPPSVYHAYAFFTLNHPELLGKRISPQELFGHLSAHESQFRHILTLTRPANPLLDDSRGKPTAH